MCCARVTGIAQDNTILDQFASYPADMGNLATSTPYGEKNLNRKSRRSWFETSPLRLAIAVEKPAMKAVKQIPETIEVLTLTHFTAPPRLGFGSIKLGQMKVCTLLLRNPHDYQQSVKVEKVPEKKGFSVTCKEMVVGAGESFPLEVTWFPLEVGGCREMILMQVDGAYRLQAYVFGTVTAAAQPLKKKTKRFGLLASKASRPFSVIHTSSLANINHQYSPELKSKKDTSSNHAEHVTAKGITRSKSNSGGVGPSKGRRSGNGKRRSTRLSGKFDMSNVTDENAQPDTLACEDSKQLKTEIKSTMLKPKEGNGVPIKKMRRSITYNSIPSVILTETVVHAATVNGFTESRPQLNKADACYNNQEIPSEGDHNRNNSTHGIAATHENPVWCQRDALKNVQADNYKNCNEPAVHKLEEPSFLQMGPHSKLAVSDASFLDPQEKEQLMGIKMKSLQARCSTSDNSLDVIPRKVSQDQPSFLEAGYQSVEQISFLEDSKDHKFVAEPSFLDSDIIHESQSNIQKLKSPTSGNLNILHTAKDVLWSAKTNNGRNIISPDTFVRETRLTRDVTNTVLMHKPLNDSIGQSSILEELKILKNFVHNKSLELDKTHDCSLMMEVNKGCVTESERRETFVKHVSSPTFPLQSIDNIRRGTFVTDGVYLKILDSQKQCEPSPRRTTFTVFKPSSKFVSSARGRSEGSPLVNWTTTKCERFESNEKNYTMNNAVFEQEDLHMQLPNHSHTMHTLSTDAKPDRHTLATINISDVPVIEPVENHGNEEGKFDHDGTFEISAEKMSISENCFSSTHCSQVSFMNQNLNNSNSTNVEVDRSTIIKTEHLSCTNVLEDTKCQNMEDDGESNAISADSLEKSSPHRHRRKLSGRRSGGVKNVQESNSENFPCVDFSDKGMQKMAMKFDCGETYALQSSEITTNSNVLDVNSFYVDPFESSSLRCESAKVIKKTSFLKKRHSPTAQTDGVCSKRTKSEAVDVLCRRNAQLSTSQHQRAPAVLSARQCALKYTGSSADVSSRQVPKMHSSMVKGVAQSKLILMKSKITGIPKHPMPFAARNVFFDERWMQKQEHGFVNWLNFILTPAEEYKGGDVKVKVDAGKLAIDMDKGRLKLAPSNEILSFKTYAAHRKLNSLRKSACCLFQTDAITHVMHKIEAEVTNGRVLVRKDKMLHADIGAKQRILDMLLSYNPLWLRMGLETIFGEIVPLQSNTDVYGLSRFIMLRLLTSPDLILEYAHPTVPHLYREGYAGMTAQHTLKKFLMLVFFLDCAKAGGLIDHNPCLFCKDSDIKASKDLLLQFSRDYLSGEGDITRHLGYLGYKVTYTQTPLDEFDFAVEKLAVDLRDGLRLTRVMEMLCHRNDLCKTLRVPAISRLQKIHNVEVVFKVLAEQGIVTGTVNVRDIVDGHREKTLQLLWNIILHYQVALLINMSELQEEIHVLERSLYVKQQLHRLKNFNNGKPMRRESNEPALHTQDERLNLLLRWCKAVCARYNIQIENFTVSFSDGRALCHIVHYYHPGLLPFEKIQQQTSITHMEKMERCTDMSSDDSFDSPTMFGMVNDPEVFQSLLNNEKENFRLLSEKVKELGGVPLLLKWSDMSNTIPDEKVVVTYLLYLCARLLDIRNESRAARILQHAWRSYRLKKVTLDIKAKERAVIILQKAIRSYLARIRLKRKQSAVRLIQRVWRGHRARLEASKLRLERKLQKQIVGITLLQAAIRCYLVRCKYLHLKAVIVPVQAYCRGMLYRRKCNVAATIIQRVYRGFKVRQQLKVMHRSAVIIQAHVRGYLVKKQLLVCVKASRVIQCKYRAYIQMKKQRKAFVNLKASCVTLQRYCKRFLKNVLQKQHHAALIIQAHVRGHQAKARYLKLRHDIILVQAIVRGHIQRIRLTKLMESVVTIQRQFRAYIVAKKARNEFLELRKAVVCMQSRYRMVLERRKYLHLLHMIIKFQALVKMMIVRRTFVKQRAAAKVLQMHYRAWTLGRICREEYCKCRNAAIAIQALLRGHVVRKNLKRCSLAAMNIQRCWRSHLIRIRFLRLRQAVIACQHRYRAKLIGKQCNENFKKFRAAVVVVQKCYRGVRCRKMLQDYKRQCIRVQSIFRMHCIRKNYREFMSAIIVVQRCYRAKRQSEIDRARYHRILTAAVVLQAAFRGRVVRKNLHRLHDHATTIQAAYRRFVCRKQFCDTRFAAMVCQQRYRANVTALAIRKAYLTTRHTAVTLQAFYRGKICRVKYLRIRSCLVKIQSLVKGKQQRTRYVKLKCAASILQRRFRELMETNELRSRFLQVKHAAIVIQAFWRGRRQRSMYSEMRRSVILLQSVVRMSFQHKKYLELKHAAVALQRRYHAQQTANRCRRHFLLCRQAAVKIQAAIRGHRVREHMKTLRASVLLAQCLFRGRIQHRAFQETKRATVICQRQFRLKLIRRNLHQNYAALLKAVVIVQAFYRGVRCRKEYLRLRDVTVRMQARCRMLQVCRNFRKQKYAVLFIQSCYRAKCLMQNERRKFLMMKVAARKIQATYRMYTTRCAYRNTISKVVSCQAAVRGMLTRRVTLRRREELLKVHESAVKIQSWYKAVTARRWYLCHVHAACSLQLRWRAELLCRKHVMDYQRLKDTVITIQSVHRGNVARRRFHQLKAAIKIQAYWRMFCVRKHFRDIKVSAVRIQHWLRVWQAKRLLANLKEKLRQKREVTLVKVVSALRANMAAIVVQRSFRNYCIWKMAREKLHFVTVIQRWVKSKLQRLRFLRYRKHVVDIQCRLHAWLARRDRAARVIQRRVRSWLHTRALERLKERKIEAAITLQSHWRGYCVRKNSNCKKLIMARRRVQQANASATEDRTLGNRTKSALDYLLKYGHLSQVLDALMHLDASTRLSPQCCERMVEVNAIVVLYRLIRSCNRSLPHMEIIKYTISILINLAKYEKTRYSVYEDPESMSTLVNLMQIYREKGVIFLKTCFLIGVLAHDDICKKIVMEDKKLVEKLQGIYTLTARKHQLDAKQKVTRERLSIANQSIYVTRSTTRKAKVKPDWLLHRDSMQEIDNPLMAISFVKMSLGLMVK